MPPSQVTSALSEAARSVEEALEKLLPDGDAPEAQLFEAMRYATLGGGKRLRPFMVLASSALEVSSWTVKKD